MREPLAFKCSDNPWRFQVEKEKPYEENRYSLFDLRSKHDPTTPVSFPKAYNSSLLHTIRPWFLQ